MRHGRVGELYAGAPSTPPHPPPITPDFQGTGTGCGRGENTDAHCELTEFRSRVVQIAKNQLARIFPWEIPEKANGIITARFLTHEEKRRSRVPDSSIHPPAPVYPKKSRTRHIVRVSDRCAQRPSVV